MFSSKGELFYPPSPPGPTPPPHKKGSNFWKYFLQVTRTVLYGYFVLLMNFSYKKVSYKVCILLGKCPTNFYSTRNLSYRNVFYAEIVLRCIFTRSFFY